MIPIRDNIPSRTLPYVTLLFIVMNVSIFIYQLRLPPGRQQELIWWAGAVPVEIFSGPAEGVAGGIINYATLITSLFLHGSFLHLAGNMLFLWVFGDNIEDRLGHLNFILFYLVCGVAASLTHIWHNPESTAPLIGASGSISGIMGAYLILFPGARIQTVVILLFFITTFWVPAVIFIALWAFLQFVNITRGDPGIAWFAHIGGFITGIVITVIAKFTAAGNK